MNYIENTEEEIANSAAYAGSQTIQVSAHIHPFMCRVSTFIFCVHSHTGHAKVICLHLSVHYVGNLSIYATIGSVWMDTIRLYIYIQTIRQHTFIQQVSTFIYCFPSFHGHAKIMCLRSYFRSVYIHTFGLHTYICRYSQFVSMHSYIGSTFINSVI